MAAALRTPYARSALIASAALSVCAAVYARSLPPDDIQSRRLRSISEADGLFAVEGAAVWPRRLAVHSVSIVDRSQQIERRYTPLPPRDDLGRAEQSTSYRLLLSPRATGDVPRMLRRSADSADGRVDVRGPLPSFELPADTEHVLCVSVTLRPPLTSQLVSGTGIAPALQLAHNASIAGSKARFSLSWTHRGAAALEAELDRLPRVLRISPDEAAAVAPSARAHAIVSGPRTYVAVMARELADRGWPSRSITLLDDRAARQA